MMSRSWDRAVNIKSEPDYRSGRTPAVQRVGDGSQVESDLIRLRTREGMKVGKAKGRLRGKQPKLKPNQAKHLLKLHDSGNCTQAELAELFGVGRSRINPTLAECDQPRRNRSDPSRT